MIKIGLVDDHALVRSGLRDFFNSHADLQVTGEGANGREALELVRRQPIDVLVMDLSMPGQNGVDALAAIQDKAPQVKVLILSGYPASVYGADLLRQGASGFINKSCTPEEILEAVRLVAQGRLYWQASLKPRLQTAPVV